MPTDLFVLGAGGHGKVVLDALLQRHIHPRLYDADASLFGSFVLGVKVERQPDPDALPPIGHLAIGDNSVRSRLAQLLDPYLSQWLTIIHPGAHIAIGVTIGAGAFVAAGAVVAPDAQVGRLTIVNHCAVVDHDCLVGEYCHIAPNATLGGGVVVEDEVLVGSGASVLPYVRIGRGARIGSGAVVTRDVSPHVTVVGAPARTVS